MIGRTYRPECTISVTIRPGLTVILVFGAPRRASTILMPEDASKNNPQEPEEQPSPDAAGSMHRATEHLRKMWVRMNQDREAPEDFGESKPDDEKPEEVK